MGQSMILSHVEHGKEMEKEKKEMESGRLHKISKTLLLLPTLEGSMDFSINLSPPSNSRNQSKYRGRKDPPNSTIVMIRARKIKLNYTANRLWNPS